MRFVGELALKLVKGEGEQNDVVESFGQRFDSNLDPWNRGQKAVLSVESNTYVL